MTTSFQSPTAGAGTGSVRGTSGKLAGTASPRVPIKIRLHEDTIERVKYWVVRESFPSVNEFMALAVEEKIARMNGDYDLPSLEVQRLNQLLDQMRSMSINLVNLESVVTNGFDSLLGLTRGDSYLQDAEDGELEVDQLSGQSGFFDASDFEVAGAVDADLFRDGFGGAP